MMKTNMTRHARFDRMSRLEYILDTVGIGEVIAEIENTHDARGGFQRLTSTGVIVITSQNKRTIVTAYIATIEQACGVYCKAKRVKRMPNNLYNRFKNNAEYVKNQPRV